jgi:dipeptidyl aminopeptidase/acylaminoacyl peptidase
MAFCLPVKDLLYYVIQVKYPVICDSTNVKGERFEEKNLLELQLNEPETSKAIQKTSVSENYKILHAGGDSVFRVDKPNEGYQLSLWKFYITPDNYMPVKLEVKSASSFVIYIDGEKKTDKKTVENSLNKAGKATVEFKAEPRQYAVIIKMLSSAKDSCETVLCAVLKTDDKDSLSVIKASSSDRRHLYLEDFNSGKKISRTSISPDGRFALINYLTTFKNGTVFGSTELYELNNCKLLWKDESNNRNLNWTTQGSKLYYTAKGAKGNELRLLDPLTLKENTIVEDLPEGDFIWSPKENYLIFYKSESAEEDKGDLLRFISPEDRQPGFRSRTSLYLYDLKTGLNRRLTYGKENTWLNDISADGKNILFSRTKSVINIEPYSESSMFMLNLETMKTDTIWFKEKYANGAVFSPDGKKLLILGGPDSFGKIGLNVDSGQTANIFDIQAFIMDLKTRDIEPATRNFNPSISNAWWNRFDRKIYMSVEDKDYQRIYVFDPDAKTFTSLPLNPDMVLGFDFALTAPRAVYYGSTNTFTGKAYTVDLKSMKETLLSNPGSDRLSSVDFNKTNDWNFKTADGTTIYGRYYLPPDFDPSKKYPMLVYYYGGTSPVTRSFESNYPLNLFAAQGYIVYTLQPSGTTGFGQKFSARHVNAWGNYTADEIILGTKLFYRSHEFADSTKIGCFGASYGGFMTMFLLTKTDMFKVAISHAGISSIASYWGEGYWGYSYSAGASSGSWPWNNRELYVEHSPLFNADKIKTPLLLLHGTEDTNVPIGESIQLYTALKILGKEVEFVRIEGENHAIRKYDRHNEWQRTQLAWFARYLKNDDRWWNDLYKKSELEK